MAKRVTGGQILENMKRGDGINYKEVIVQLKPDTQTGRTVKKLRLIGLPIEFYEANPKKISPDDPTKTIPYPFPDDAQNKSFTRVCNDDPSEDIWTKMGYLKSKRYAINCIDREDGKVKVLARGAGIFNEFYKTEKDNSEENVDLAGSGELLLWTLIGGEEAPDVKITALYDEKAFGKVTYDVRFSPKVNKLTSEEIDLIKSIGCPTPEQLKIIRAENPDLADVPDWFFYGYDLEKMYKPAVLRTPDSAPVDVKPTPISEMNIATDDDDEDEDETTPVVTEDSGVSEVTTEIAEEEVTW